MASNYSTPSSPGSSVFPDNEVSETNGLRLQLAPFGLEKIYDYEQGGLHPVHLGDVYGDDRQYRVIHKLGSGGFATVWLCRDIKVSGPTKYVAIKILIAESADYSDPELRMIQLSESFSHSSRENNGEDSICLPLDNFRIDGPNGRHLCLVYPVLGPQVSLGFFWASKSLDNDLRVIGLQTAKAVQWLHSQGICHGDITTRNVLHRVVGLDGLSEEEVLKVLGNPKFNPVLNESQKQHDGSGAPKYLVYPVSWRDVDARLISKETRLIDFGECFEISQPPDDLGVPGPYRSPELMLDKKAGVGSDIWALACTLFEIRTGRKLFQPFDDEDDAYLADIVEVLGRLPEPWWSTTWEMRKRWYRDDVDDQGRVVHVRESKSKKDRSATGGQTSRVHPAFAGRPRCLEEKLAPGLWYLDHPGEDFHRDIAQNEQKVFASLLKRLLAFKPEDRISAEEAAKHEWFRLS